MTDYSMANMNKITVKINDCIINVKDVRLDFSNDDYEIAEQRLALVLIKSLHQKGKISGEIMKEIEQTFGKSDCDS